MNNSRFIGELEDVNFNGCKSWHTDVSQPWHGTDSEKTFEYNKKKYPDHPDFLRYDKNSITYKFNNLGFRSDFDYYNKDAGNVYIGCSMTEGVGLKWNETYQEHLSQTLEGKRINLSVGGSGIDTWSRLLFQYKDFFQIQRVFLLGTNWPRYEFISDYSHIGFTLGGDAPKKHALNQIDPRISKYRPIIVDSLSHDSYINLNFNLKLMAISKLCELINAQFYYLSILDPAISQGIKLDYGRDLAHFGPKWQKRVADIFTKMVEEKEK